MNNFKKVAYLVITALIFFSCSKDDDVTPVIPLGDFEKGILISNEGPFGTGTGTITYVSEDFSTVKQSIFNTVNNSDLGNIVQSIGFNDDLAYIVVNNSHLVKVVNRYTFKELATINTGLNNPRFFVAVGTTGYITNWGDTADETDDYVAVVDLLTNTITASIPVTFGPEELVVSGNTVYVAHQGAYGQNNIISVINTTNNSVSETITVGDVPNSMVLSGTNLWVLCGGTPSFTGNETAGQLVKISTNSNTVIQTLNFELEEHPNFLSLEGSTMFYVLNGGVRKMEITATTLPTASIISGFFYGMTTHNGKLYATDAGDFASDGTLKVYDLTTNVETQSVAVGIIPGGIYFNE